MPSSPPCVQGEHDRPAWRANSPKLSAGNVRSDRVEFPHPPIQIPVLLETQCRRRRLAFKVSMIDQHGGQIRQNFRQAMSDLIALSPPTRPYKSRYFSRLNAVVAALRSR